MGIGGETELIEMHAPDIICSQKEGSGGRTRDPLLIWEPRRNMKSVTADAIETISVIQSYKFNREHRE